eukprot:1124536-Alexandrium_andersonii.AAC.1
MLVAVKLLAQVEPNLSDTLDGLRHRRSIADPIHMIGRAQDLVQAKQYTTLHVVFLGWEKAFDR